MVDRPYQHVKRALAEGNASASFTAECLMDSDGVEDEDSIRWAAGSMYGGKPFLCLSLRNINLYFSLSSWRRKRKCRSIRRKSYKSRLIPKQQSFATILTFIYAMAMYPDVQARIHEEIDRTIGIGRLPSLDDQDQLPYVRAAIKETMRWKPALPMSIPRMTTQDDHYNGKPRKSTSLTAF